MLGFRRSRNRITAEEQQGLAGLLLGPASVLWTVSEGHAEAKAVLLDLFAHPAFQTHVIQPLDGGTPLPHNRMGAAALMQARMVTQSLTGEKNKGLDWVQLLQRLLSTELGETALLAALGDPEGMTLKTRVEQRAGPDIPAYACEIGRLTRTHIEGYALDLRKLDTPLTLKVHIDGFALGPMTADQHSRALEDRFASSGKHHFSALFELPPAFHFRDWLNVTVTDAATGNLLLRERHLLRYEGRAGLLLRLATSLTDIRDQLKSDQPPEGQSTPFKALEARLNQLSEALPGLLDFTACPVDLYSEYRSLTKLPEPESCDHADLKVPVIIVSDDAGPDSPLARSLARQTYKHWTLDTQMKSNLDADSWVLPLSADTELQPFALEALAAAAQNSSAHCLHFDYEQTVGGSPHQPILHRIFDYDLTLSGPETAPGLMLRSSTFKETPPETFDLLEAALDLWTAEGPAAFEGVPFILAAIPKETRLQPHDPDTCNRHLSRRFDGGARTPHHDPIGGDIRGAYQVRWPKADGERLSIIIPTRDHIDLVEACVLSLRQKASDPGALDIIIVDNGSRERASRSWFKREEKAGRVRVCKDSGDFNWSRLNNAGRQIATGTGLLFLNNDTEALTDGFDQRILALLARPEIGCIGARLLYPDMTLQHGGTTLTQGGVPHHEGVGTAPTHGLYLNRTRLTHSATTVTGAALAVSTAVFDSVGGFDADAFPVAYNDTDFCMKVRSAGRTVLYDPRLSFVHHESKSRGYDWPDPEKRARNLTEKDRFLERWPDAAEGDPYVPDLFSATDPPYTRLTPVPRKRRRR